MATATAAAAAAPGLLTTNTWTASERMKIQLERIQNQQYRKIGKLTSIVLERQMSTVGMSQSKPRYSSPEGHKYCLPGMEPFSEWQMKAWASMTLEYLHPSKAPELAISDDRHDLLLPFGLKPLPDIPDPLWIPGRAKSGRFDSSGAEIAPRVPQRLEDRACGQIKQRNGRLWLVFQPITELCVCIGGARGGFGRIVCKTDPADRTHSALLVDPEPIDRDGNLQAHFIGGSFQAGW